LILGDRWRMPNAACKAVFAVTRKRGGYAPLPHFFDRKKKALFDEALATG